ncbi:conserved hypothetical protein [Uncinocarpus reesii 1704]|uniref:Protein FYV10 n=1 Tax=Uncinocarpus reesii (strain UAMH 1704) TaxID=336963 RepID=C4JDL5_UNCRE|nr:uncharacterized protein UREG_00724 [Uncinocarpus reesii 1704]EEP75877.1 conserved hypothetical protein [Uncinocarpus reesii 1704]
MASTNVMSPTPSTTTPTWHNFERKVEEVKPSKTDINFLVMDYLVTNGYPLAARKFAVEANLRPQAAIESIQERVDIRNAIHSGDIQSAIEKINELNPRILDCNASLHFALLQLQLIELIRICTATPNGDISPALDFATSQLAPRAPTNPQFLEDLEKTMSLLIFSAENLSPSLAALLDPELRKTIANRVNEAILQSQGAKREARLRNLVKLRAWAEKKVRQSKKQIPEKLDIGLDGDTGNSNTGSNDLQNNGEDVVMQEQAEVDPMVT